MHKIYKLNGEEVYLDDNTKVNKKKVIKSEEANLSTKKLKTYALYAGLILVIGLNAYGVGKYLHDTEPKKPDFQSDYAYTFDINETEWCEPIENTQYFAPAGYTLTWIDGKPYAVKETESYTSVITITNEAGTTTYAAPEGYRLEYRDGKPYAVKTSTEYADVVTSTQYVAPAGYVLIGDKCFKLNETEEHTKGR